MSTQATIGFLSEDYLAELEKLAASTNQQPIAHVNVRVQFHVTGTPEDAVDYYLLVEKGIIVKASRGLIPDAELAITTAYRDLAAFQAGDLHAATAFVTGQFAVTGDKAKLLDLMIVFGSGHYHEFVADLWSRTTW